MTSMMPLWRCSEARLFFISILNINSSVFFVNNKFTTL